MPTQTNLFIDELYQKIELEMLMNIGKIIGNGNGVDEDDIINWQVQKLSQLGQLSEAQIKTLAKYANMTVEQMTVFIQQTAIAEITTYDVLLDDMAEGTLLYTPPTNTLYTTLEALERQGRSVVNMINTNLLQASSQVYTDILTRSAAQVLTGNLTLQQALVKTAGEWAKQGMPAIVDKAGRTWSTEAYVNMVTRATQKNVATSMQESRMDDYEIDLVEISSHAASRPSHIDYQGKIYSRSGKSKKYPSLKDTSYGKGADGLVTGIGCNHIAYPFISGMSTKRYEPYDKKESVEAYKQSQKQRYLEREIRRSKKELEMLEQMGVDADEITLAKQNLKEKLENMEDFIDETGRTRYKHKERVVDVGKKVDIPKDAKPMTPQKAKAQATNVQKANETKKIVEKAIAKKPTAYTNKQIDAMSDKQLLEVARDLSLKYHASGKTGISYGGRTPEEVTNAMLVNQSKTNLKKDIKSMQRSLQQWEDESVIDVTGMAEEIIRPEE